MGPRPAQAAVQIPNLAYTDFEINATADHSYGMGLRILTQDANGNFTGYFYPKGAPAIPMTGVISAGASFGGNPISFTAKNLNTVISYTGTLDARDPSALFMAGTFSSQTMPVFVGALSPLTVPVSRGLAFVSGPWPFCAHGGPLIP